MAEEDARLLRRLQAGDDEAVARLYERYAGRLLRYFTRMLGAHEAAEDALQELFLKLIDGVDTIDVDRDLQAWLFAAAHHQCCNEYRARQVRQRAAAPLRAHLEATPQASPALDDAVFRVRLDAELGRLSPDHRSAFLLRHQEGLPLQQIAAIAGVPTGTVKSRLHTACRLLAERLQDLGTELLTEGFDDIDREWLHGTREARA